MFDTATDASDSAENNLLLIPLVPEHGAIADNEPLCVGVTVSLARLLNESRRYPIDFLYVPLPSSSTLGPSRQTDPMATVKAENPLGVPFIAVGGRFAWETILPLILEVTAVHSKECLGKKRFGTAYADGDSLDGLLRDIASWLKDFGDGYGSIPVDNQLLPTNATEWRDDAIAHGLEWLAAHGDVPEEFSAQLAQDLQRLRGRLSHPFSAQRVRMLVGNLLSSLESRSADWLALQTQPFDELLAQGSEHGHDPVAFRMCRAFRDLRLGRYASALAMFHALKEVRPKDALRGIGMVHETRGQWRDAQHAYREALTLIEGNEYMVDATIASSLPPSSTTPRWRGELEMLLGRVAISEGNAEHAEAALQRALKHGADRGDALELLAALYQQIFMACDGLDPDGAQHALVQLESTAEALFQHRGDAGSIEAGLEIALLCEDNAKIGKWYRRREAQPGDGVDTRLRAAACAVK